MTVNKSQTILNGAGAHDARNTSASADASAQTSLQMSMAFQMSLQRACLASLHQLSAKCAVLMMKDGCGRIPLESSASLCRVTVSLKTRQALLPLGGQSWNGIVSELAFIGYDMQWHVLPACAVGAGHRRERLFLLATNAGGEGLERYARHGHGGCHWRERDAGQGRPIATPDLRFRTCATEKWFTSQSPFLRVVDGLPGGLAKAALRCTGNAVVPQVAQIFARAIKFHIEQSYAAA